MFRVKHSSALRPEVNKDPELKVLSKKPLSQLTDDELYRVYAPTFYYLSDAPEPVADYKCSCLLCMEK